MIVIQDQNGNYFSEFGSPKLSGTAFPVFNKAYQTQPVSVVTFSDAEDAQSVLRVLRSQIDNHTLMTRRHGEIKIVDIGAELERLRKEVKMLEEMRPMWAMGYTDDGIAAQSFSSALKQLWKMLDADNQTTAIGRLKKLKGEL